jgi:hypothetical protein
MFSVYAFFEIHGHNAGLRHLIGYCIKYIDELRGKSPLAASLLVCIGEFHHLPLSGQLPKE